MPSARRPHAYVARHGETEWSLTGQHTGNSDIPITPNGEAQARALGGRIAEIPFDRAWTSPLIRARTTAELALGGRLTAEVDPDLAEWDYGTYDGLTSDQIHAQDPNWFLFRDGGPGGDRIDGGDGADDCAPDAADVAFSCP